MQSRHRNEILFDGTMSPQNDIDLKEFEERVENSSVHGGTKQVEDRVTLTPEDVSPHM